MALTVLPEVTKSGILLEKTDLDFESAGVFNPACHQIGNEVHMFYRAVNAANYSSIGYCRLSDPLTVSERLKEPVYQARHPLEIRGVEDPRITKIEGTYYMTYTAYDGLNALGSLAVSDDMKSFTRIGPVTPLMKQRDFLKLAENSPSIPDRYYHNVFVNNSLPEHKNHMIWDKDVIFFPRRIQGKLAFLHRILPGIQIVYCNAISDLTDDFWEDYFTNFSRYIVLESKYAFEKAYIGGGCVPVETPQGWLIIYHGAEETPRGKVYHAAAALLDIDDPTREIARLKIPLFSPEREWELNGQVNNVVFPTGTAQIDGRLYIYYGAADLRIGVASLSTKELIDALISDKINS